MKRLDQAGFTFLELIITASIIGIVVVIVIEGFVSIGQLNRNARNLTIATQLAQQQIEQVRNTAYNNIAEGTTDISTIMTPYPSLENPRSATQTVTVINPNGLKQVDIALEYTVFNRTKKVQVTTQVSSVGINK